MYDSVLNIEIIFKLNVCNSPIVMYRLSAFLVFHKSPVNENVLKESTSIQCASCVPLKFNHDILRYILLNGSIAIAYGCHPHGIPHVAALQIVCFPSE